MAASDQPDAAVGEDMSGLSLSDYLPPPPPPLPLPPAVSRRLGQKYRSYTDADMAAAEREVTENGLSIRQASKKYRIPKTTLAGHLGDQRPRLPPRKATGDKPTGTRYTWIEADMEKALEAIEQGTVKSVGQAARRFGVPSSFLNARKKGRAPRSLKGDLSRLTFQQENLIADWASAQVKLGIPPRQDELFSLAERVLQKQGIDRRLGKQWVHHWMRRFPDIEVLDWKNPEPPKKPETPKKDEQPKRPEKRTDADVSTPQVLVWVADETTPTAAQPLTHFLNGGTESQTMGSNTAVEV